MKSGTALVVGLAAVLAVAGAAMYYLQVYAFYYEVDAEGGILLWGQDGSAAASVEPLSFAGIDADSSPIRYRSCFDLGPLRSDIPARLVAYPDPAPPVAPHWFDCFDAEAIGQDLEAGRAAALFGFPTDAGIDRVVALYPDGHGFAWNQINACTLAEVQNDPLPEGCVADAVGALPAGGGPVDLSTFFDTRN